MLHSCILNIFKTSEIWIGEPVFWCLDFIFIFFSLKELERNSRITSSFSCCISVDIVKHVECRIWNYPQFLIQHWVDWYCFWIYFPIIGMKCIKFCTEKYLFFSCGDVTVTLSVHLVFVFVKMGVHVKTEWSYGVWKFHSFVKVWIISSMSSKQPLWQNELYHARLKDCQDIPVWGYLSVLKLYDFVFCFYVMLRHQYMYVNAAMRFNMSPKMQAIFMGLLY